MKKPPCGANCPDRKPACQSRCEKFAEWKVEIEDRKAKVRKAKARYSLLDDFKIDAVTKSGGRKEKQI